MWAAVTTSVCQAPCSAGQSRALEDCVCAEEVEEREGACYELRDSEFEPGLAVIIKHIYQGRSVEHILFNSLLD